MTDQTETTIYEDIPATGLGWGIYTATVTTNDTVTLSNYTGVLDVIVIRLSNNSVCTYTTATNVVTITTASLTSVKVLISVVGYK